MRQLSANEELKTFFKRKRNYTCVLLFWSKHESRERHLAQLQKCFRVPTPSISVPICLCFWSNFLLISTLLSSKWWLKSSVSATHMGNSDWIPDSWQNLTKKRRKRKNLKRKENLEYKHYHWLLRLKEHIPLFKNFNTLIWKRWEETDSDI